MLNEWQMKLLKEQRNKQLYETSVEIVEDTEQDDTIYYDEFTNKILTENAPKVELPKQREDGIQLNSFQQKVIAEVSDNIGRNIVKEPIYEATSTLKALTAFQNGWNANASSIKKSLVRELSKTYGKKMNAALYHEKTDSFNISYNINQVEQVAGDYPKYGCSVSIKVTITPEKLSTFTIIDASIIKDRGKIDSRKAVVQDILDVKQIVSMIAKLTKEIS